MSGIFVAIFNTFSVLKAVVGNAFEPILIKKFPSAPIAIVSATIMYVGIFLKDNRNYATVFLVPPLGIGPRS